MPKLSTGAKTIEREDGTEVELTTALDRKRRIDTAYEVYMGVRLPGHHQETKYVSSINYFGKPVYTYSLKQGIQDGFLRRIKSSQPSCRRR
jgi:type I restriction enzyme R subunit